MGPQAGTAAVLAFGYTVAVEACIKGILGLSVGRFTLGELPELLRASASDRNVSDVSEKQRLLTSKVRAQRPLRHQFWTYDLPAELQRRDVQIIALRNAATHGDNVAWESVDRLRQSIVGSSRAPGLIVRLLTESASTN
jgi:hypothetical protein